MREEILELLNELNPNADFESSSNIIEEGLLDSLQVLELIDMLCEKNNITIEPEDIDPDNFATVDTIIDLLNSKK